MALMQEDEAFAQMFPRAPYHQMAGLIYPSPSAQHLPYGWLSLTGSRGTAMQYEPLRQQAGFSTSSSLQQPLWPAPFPSTEFNQPLIPMSQELSETVSQVPLVDPPSTPSMYHDIHKRPSRSSSFTSEGAYTTMSSPQGSRSRRSRSTSPSSADLRNYGYLNKQGTWSCAYPGCASRAVFTRGCDLRKHHKRHMKSFFCSHEGCPQASGGGFSSKKDLARHEAKHNPKILCDWKGCERVFSRVDNMVRSNIKTREHSANRS